MDLNFLAPALTEGEKQFLFEQNKSEHFRVFSKAITYLYSLEAAKMTQSAVDQLQNFQGRAQGLLMAKNLLIFGKMPDNK